jgi:hypothetical protein
MTEHVRGACVSSDWFAAQNGCDADAPDGCADMEVVCHQRWALLAGALASAQAT